MSIVILRSAGPQNNPKHFTPEFCEKLQQVDPVAYQTDVMGEFANPETGLLSPISVRKNTRETPLELAPENDAEYAAAIDTSEGMSGNNPWTLVIVEGYNTEDDDLAAYRVALAREWRGLRPEQCWSEIAQECNRFGLRSAAVDQYAASANADLAKQEGLTLHVVPWTAANKLEAFSNLATLIHADRVELSPDRTFRRDLLSVKKRVTQTGQTIVLPKTSDGRHCDFAPALAAAVREATQRCQLGDLSIGRIRSQSPGRTYL